MENLDYNGVLKIVKSTIEPHTYPKIPKKEISEKSKIIYDLGLDSLDTVNLILGLEKKLGILIPDEFEFEFTDSFKVGDFTGYVHGLVKEKTEIKNKIDGIIKENSYVKGEINQNEILQETSGVDSLSIIEIIYAIKEEYNLKNIKKDTKKLRTSKNLVDYVIKNKN